MYFSEHNAFGVQEGYNSTFDLWRLEDRLVVSKEH